MNRWKYVASLACLWGLLLSFACPPPVTPQEPAAESPKGDANAPQDTPTPQDTSSPTDKTKPTDEAKPADDPPTPTKDPAIEAVDKFISGQSVDKSSPNWRTTLSKPPQATFDANSEYFWVLKTNKGTMKIKFLQKVAPMHVTSTIYLTRLGFYDTLTFHRVITGFMAQGGDPLGNGRGGPGYKYSGEFSASARHSKAGILSMAHAGPGTDGSQFFITFKATPHLDGVHTVFGELSEGMETLKALEASGSSSGTPKEKLFIEKATIEVKPAP